MGGSQPNEVTVRRVGWSDTVKAHIKRVPVLDPTSTADLYRNGVEDGRFIAHAVIVNGQHKATIISSIHQGEAGLEWSLEAAGSEDGRLDLTAMGLAGAEQLARQAGCRVVRFQTHRQGLMAKAVRQGYRMDEVVLRKELGNGQ